MAATGILSYLTCTAAQAKEFNERNPHNIVSLNQLLETRATSHPDVCVACFPEYIPEENRWRLLTFTFVSLLSVSDALATYYVDNTALTVRRAEDTTDRIVALLSPSCADLLVTLFSAIRLGYGVLLLAPQNTPEAIAHLCRTTNATHLVCHDSLVDQAQAALEDVKGLSIVPVAPRTAWKTLSRQLRFGVRPEIEKELTALVMHTSGSTGMPKPIYHPHRIWTEAIPFMPGVAAFTTTPLFHGGSADLLRSMNAVSTLYIFSSTYPMTVKNIAGALAVCPGVDAFLSVPYILKMLAENREGLEILRIMSLVSTGGAPLPEALGNDMVRQGVRLVSRLGSSECGFLMSSHRDYENDKEWSWLRNLGLGVNLLHFEPMGDSEGEGVFELVVDKEWTTRIVPNRPDGSFASGDLYAKHPTIPDAWRYHGRTDDIVVLITGKKASANPIETALRACPSVSEAIVFGSGRPALGVLILPASATITRDDILERVHLVNASQSSYAHLLDDLVIVLPLDAAPAIPKTSKGSVTRPKALAIFAETINKAYQCLENGIVGTDAMHEDVISNPTDGQIRAYLRGAVADALRVERGSSKGIAPSQIVGDNEDLFNAGIDSVRAVLVRSRLQKLVATHGKSISNNVVFEHPSITRLVQHVIQILDGDEDYLDPVSNIEGQHRLMLELVEAHNVKTMSNAVETANKVQFSPTADTAGVVILTGVTGSLGVHVLAQILVRTHLRVIALVRAAGDAEALERVKAILAKRKLLKYYEPHQERVEAFASDLRHERLGLTDAIYGVCLERAVAVVHIAWPVNFAMSLDSFRPALDATRNLLEFTAHTHRKARFIFCSSTAAAVNTDNTQRTVPESVCENPHSSSALGYAQAKWVAEHICSKAYQTLLPGRVVITRVGQLCGDTEHGVWNESEAWPLLIASVRYTECLPIFAKEELGLLPFDIAAATFVDVIEHDAWFRDDMSIIPVLHIVNPVKIRWINLLDLLESSGVHFKRTDASRWIEKLEICTSVDLATQGLISLWRNKCADDRSAAEEQCYDISSARETSASMARLESEQVITPSLVQKWVTQWRAVGFLQ